MRIDLERVTLMVTAEHRMDVWLDGGPTNLYVLHGGSDRGDQHEPAEVWAKRPGEEDLLIGTFPSRPAALGGVRHILERLLD
jgi:hypothetical protein